jgi:hypothetical protein
MYDYDWFHGQALGEQIEQAKLRCTLKKFPQQDAKAELAEEPKRFKNELEVRILLYLRDGFSYELKSLVELGSKAHLTFECEPIEDQYKVGAFIVSVPYEEVVRVEVFAVHPSERPADAPVITGFRNAPEPGPGGPQREERPPKISVTSEELT